MDNLLDMMHGTKRKPVKNTDASSSDSSGEADQEEGPDILSDDDGLVPTLEFCVEPNKYWTTLEDADIDRIELLACELRDRPLLPPCPEDPSTPWHETISGIAFPTCHCAFLNCDWVSDCMPCAHRSAETSLWVGSEGRWRIYEPCLRAESGLYACCGACTCLRQHIVDAHSDLFIRTCSLSASITNCYSYYLEAICHKEQQTMPRVGTCIDRRTFRHVAADITEDAIRGMVCMCCDRSSTSCNGTTDVATVRTGIYFKHINTQSFRLNWSFAVYLERYCKVWNAM
jgi:hypothetical protein